MILTKDHNHGDYEIHSYQPGKLVINETTYYQSILVATHQLEAWLPQNFQELRSSDFVKILTWHPDVVLLGTGETLKFPPDTLLRAFCEQKIGVEVMSTLAACRTFNVLMAENRRAVAALLIR